MKGIYQIISPTGKFYIGQSSNIEKRKSYYRLLRCKGQTLLYSSLKKYGFNNHEFNIIELEEDSDLLDEKERFYFDYFTNLGHNMLNLMIPGKKGNRGFSNESKRKISLSKLGGPITQFTVYGEFVKIWESTSEIKEKLGLNPPAITAHIRGCSLTCGGFIFKKGEFSDNIDISLSYKKRRFNNIKYHRKKRPVFQYTLGGELLKEWDSMVAASEMLSLNKKCISSVCRGKTTQTGGFKWSTKKIVTGNE